MVTNCKNCGLPIFHGAAGYAGPQCMCKLVTLPQMFDESMARIVALEAERDQIKAENERLKAVPMKYKRMEHNAKLQAENDTLRKQLDEARELLDLAMCKPYGRWDLLDKIDAWLEANKV